MSQPPTSVQFREAGHRYGRRVLFARLSLAIEPGEVLIICGTNGSGKSTLLKLVAGLLRPAAGSVTVERGGVALGGDARRAAVGYLAPEIMPYRPLTVRENLRFFARVRGLRDRVEETAELVGVTARLDDLVEELSSGYVQRVKLAMALLHDPPVLLLDEPSVTLDDEGQRQVAAVIERQRARGLCLVAANDPRDMAYGSRLLRLGG